MPTKQTDARVNEWYWKRPDGSKQGPADLQSVRQNVLAGEITSQTDVSTDGRDWIPAVSAPDLGFDCIVLEVGENLNVLGPFAREYIDRDEVMADVPPDGILYVRGGTVSEIVPGGVSGETGAALVGKVMSAEKRLRESLKQKRAADAALAARDLEFDAERQKLNSEISSLKAEVMKICSERDDLRTEVETAEDDTRRTSTLEAKLVDAENTLAKTAAEVGRLKDSVAAGERKAAELKTALSEAASTAREAEEKQKTLQTRLSETGRQLGERERRCVELEGRLAEQDESAAELQHRVSDLETANDDLEDRLRVAKTDGDAAGESAAWMRDALANLARQAESRFARTSSPGQTVAGSEGELEAEFVEDTPPGHPMQVQVRTAPKETPHVAKLSAIENQLKREISTLGAAKVEKGKKSGSVASGHEGFIHVFKRKR